MFRVLIACGDTRIRKRLHTGLDELGYRVTTANTNAQVWQALMRQETDYLVLDASTANDELLPWQLVSELGSLYQPHLIVLTRSGPNQDRSRAFRSGVCFVLSLPASPAELAGMIKSISKADRKVLDGEGRVADYSDSHLRISLNDRQIRRKGKTYTLTGREHSMLKRMIENAGRVTLSQDLCKWVWGRGAWPSKRMQLKIHIMQLRRKIEPDYTRPRYLISHRGMGYAFMPVTKGKGTRRR